MNFQHPPIVCLLQTAEDTETILKILSDLGLTDARDFAIRPDTDGVARLLLHEEPQLLIAGRTLHDPSGIRYFVGSLSNFDRLVRVHISRRDPIPDWPFDDWITGGREDTSSRIISTISRFRSGELRRTELPLTEAA